VPKKLTLYWCRFNPAASRGCSAAKTASSTAGSCVLRLRKPPHQNTIGQWTNDPRLTPILERMLAVTAQPFRAVEIAGIVDSSKVSQMRSAHARWVEYGDDEREEAD